jgi:hypothetical protein
MNMFHGLWSPNSSWGANLVFTTFNGLLLDPTSTTGSGTITNWHGIHILDNTSTTIFTGGDYDSILIDSVARSSATQGNIRFGGGDFDTGHLQLNTGHIWATSGDLRFKDSAPVSATDYQLEITSARVHVVPELEIDGALNHDGTTVGLYGVTPVVRSAAYTPTNVTTDRSYDANATSMDELADVLGTLVADLQATGIIA